MKLPKNFGGQGYGGMLEQAKAAMARAQRLEEELENDRLPIDKGPVKAVVDGRGKLVSIKIDPSVVDPNDVEALEDLIVSVVRDGFDQGTEYRERKVKEIMPDIPGF